MTASASDPDGDLKIGYISSLGVGDQTGNLVSPVPLIGGIETLSGSNDTVVRAFTIPINIGQGPYTFRTTAEDHGTSTNALDWLVVDVENAKPDIAILGVPPIANWWIDRYISWVWDDIDGSVTYFSIIDQYGTFLASGFPIIEPGNGLAIIRVFAPITNPVIFTYGAVDDNGDVSIATTALAAL